jgi:hypothetical protein
VRGCNVDDIDIGVVDKLCVRAVCLSGARCLHLFQESRGSASGRGRRSGSNDMLDIMDIANSWVREEIFGKH